MRRWKFCLLITVAGMLIYSCGKTYLDKQPLGQVGETAIANKKGVEGLLIGAYSLLDGIGSNRSSYYSGASNWLFGSICGSEAYTGSDDGDGARETALSLETFSPLPTNSGLADKWAVLYDGVQRSNDVLRLMAKATDISQQDMSRIGAEARFLRAHYHFEAKKIWNKIPFVNDSITYANGNYRLENDRVTWPDIESDLRYAMNNLNDPEAINPGRANKYSAMALLAKVCLFQNNFNEAKTLLEMIINSGKYTLSQNYHDNFNPETKNSGESIFSVQMSVNDGSIGMNGNYGDVLNFPHNGGPGGCCGFFSPSQYLVNHFKTNAVAGIPDLENFNNIDVTSDEGLSSSDPSFIPYTGTLDPRLDWTVGRRGIPYLDWGEHPGQSWTRSQGGPFSPKKNVYSKLQQARFSDVGFWSTGTTANNVNLIRYADVLLWAAEVEVEIGTLEKARNYVNQLRARAANPLSWVKKADGTPAANYKVGEYTNPWPDKDFGRKVVRYERMLELSMEGHRFFDLVRWNIANIEINGYLQAEKRSRRYLNGAVFKKNCHEYFPIPQTQIDLSAGADGIKKMKQNCY